jgi:LysM repeat protein
VIAQSKEATMSSRLLTSLVTAVRSIGVLRFALPLALALGLLLPTAAPVSAATCATQHVVQPGENLFRIGLKYNLSWIIIMQANGLTNPNRIYAGQVLCIPQGGAGTIPVQDTPVQYVLALADVTVYSGPGSAYAVIGQVFAGQTARVTGLSLDWGWWRVICPGGSSGNCFVSANPQLTQPSPGPGPGCTDRARFVRDITIPDDANLPAGIAFVKTWRLRNEGTCTWGSGYALVFAGGEQMGGASSLPLSAVVRPGDTVDVSVSLTAPLSVGAHRGYWQLLNANGQVFGIGPNANKPFWVQVVSYWTVSSIPTSHGLAG